MQTAFVINDYVVAHGIWKSFSLKKKKSRMNAISVERRLASFVFTFGCKLTLEKIFSS